MPLDETSAKPTKAQAAKDAAAERVAVYRARQAEVRRLLVQVAEATDPGERDWACEQVALFARGNGDEGAALANLAVLVDVLAEAEALRDAARRNAEQLGLEAERDYDRLYATLWPAISAAAEARRETLTGKTLKLLPWTSRQLQWRWDRAEKVEVEDEREAVADLEARLGFGEPERLGLVKHTPRLSRTKLREWIGVDRDTGELRNEPPRGVEVEPRQERLRPWRW